MPGEQRQIDEGDDVVHRVVVLGDAERPADLGTVGAGVRVRRLPDDFRRDAGDLLGVLQGVGLDVGPERLEIGRGALDERQVGEPGVDDLAGHRVRERDVGPDVEAEPVVGPLRGRRTPGVYDEEPAPR